MILAHSKTKLSTFFYSTGLFAACLTVKTTPFFYLTILDFLKSEKSKKIKINKNYTPLFTAINESINKLHFFGLAINLKNTSNILNFLQKVEGLCFRRTTYKRILE